MKIRNTLVTVMLALSALAALAQPQGVDSVNNRIMLNGDDWSMIYEHLERGNGKFTVVHIGDSHVQPGIISDEVSKAMQQHYGNGGRGLICPLALAGTNAPSDYVLKSSAAISASSRLISRNKPAGMGMTGVAVKFAGGSTTLTIGTKQEGDDFDRITVFHAAGQPFEVSQDGSSLKGRHVSATASSFDLNGLTDSAALRLRGDGALYGIRLLNRRPGVVVDCIGNNGATFSSYLHIDGFAQQLKDLDPQLVIISLGTNEAYGNYSSLESNIDRLITSIRRECPGAKFLLTTPLETHKKGGRGYVVQGGIAGVRDIIMRYALKHKIAVWDFYSVAGGKGAAAWWLKVKYMSSDHLHLLNRGYHYMGSLLAQALLKTISTNDSGEMIPSNDAEEMHPAKDKDDIIPVSDDEEAHPASNE